MYDMKKYLNSLVILKKTEFQHRAIGPFFSHNAPGTGFGSLVPPKQNLEFKLGHFIYWTDRNHLTDQTQY